MATDRTNPNSWQSDSNRLKDFRSSKDGPEVTAGPRRKKDTNRWCKGKVGREHDYTKYIPSHYFRDKYDPVCSVCNKVGNWMNTYDSKGNLIK